jgi:hypothetical protein
MISNKQNSTEAVTETVQLYSVSSKRVTVQVSGHRVSMRKFFFEEKWRTFFLLLADTLGGILLHLSYGQQERQK